MNLISSLPFELKYQILIYTPIETVYSYCLTNKVESQLCQDNYFWQKKAVYDFKITDDLFKNSHLKGIDRYMQLKYNQTPIKENEIGDYLSSKPSKFAYFLEWTDEYFEYKAYYYFQSTHYDYSYKINQVFFVPQGDSSQNNLEILIPNSFGFNDIRSLVINHNQLDLISLYNILITQRNYWSRLAKLCIIAQLDTLYYDFLKHSSNIYLLSKTLIYLYTNANILMNTLDFINIKSEYDIFFSDIHNNVILDLKSKIDILYRTIRSLLNNK